MASKTYHDLAHMQRCKGKVVPRLKDKRKYKLLQAARKQLKENIKHADERSVGDSSRPSGDSYINNVWGF